MNDAIEDLHSLADECREWAKAHPVSVVAPEDWDVVVRGEFKRLADALDKIAKAIAEKQPCP